MKKIVALLIVISMSTLLCACGGGVSDMSVADLKAKDSKLSLELKEEGSERIYVDSDYEPFMLSPEGKVTVYADDDNHIKKIELQLDSGSIEGLEKMGDCTYMDMIIGTGKGPDVPLDESKGDPRTGAYYASWTYSPFIDNLCKNKAEHKEWEKVTYEEMADGVSVGDWDIDTEDDGEGLLITIEAN